MKPASALATLALAALLAGVPALAAGAGPQPSPASGESRERHALALAPRYEPGDAYRLSLRTTSDTEATARTTDGERVDERVALDYRATVRVLEVDESGLPVREVHKGVELTVERGGAASSYFREGTAYEVRRGRGKGVRLFVDGERVRSKVERLVTRALERQFEHTLGPELFEPGAPVAVGERWELDRALARRFLEQRGLRVLAFGEPATATLRRSAEDELVIDYAIPVDWLELERMPHGAKPSETTARVEGEIRLHAEPKRGLLEHASELALELRGAVAKPGVRRSYGWSLRSRRSAEQSTKVVQR